MKASAVAFVTAAAAFAPVGAKAAPANDNFAAAEVIAGAEGYVSGSNLDATIEVGEWHDCDPFATVWYKWTPETSGTVFFGVAAGYDSIIGVYTGTSVDALNTVEFNDDADAYYGSMVAFDADAGKTYYIMVGGYDDAEGTFDLEWGAFEYDYAFDVEDGVLWGFEYVNGPVPSSLTIPEGVTSIAKRAFEEFNGITTVNLPSTLKSIGEYAFGWCGKLENVNGLTDAVELGVGAFLRTPFNEKLPFGLEIVDQCVEGFRGPCPASVVIPEGVTSKFVV